MGVADGADLGDNLSHFASRCGALVTRGFDSSASISRCAFAFTQSTSVGNKANLAIICKKF